MSLSHKTHGADPDSRTAAVLAMIVRRYRMLRHQLSDRLARGEKDHGPLSALSQEIGRMRQKIRDDLARRRARRRMRASLGKPHQG